MQTQQRQQGQRSQSRASGAILNGLDVGKLEETIQAVRKDKKLAKFKFKTKNHWINGAHSVATINDYEEANENFKRSKSFKMECDEPPQLLGTNLGASPAEYALTSLSSCMATSLAYQGAAEGKKIESIEAEYEGDVDVQGFLHIDPKVRNGFKEVTVNLKVKGDVSKQDIERLAKMSPIYDSLVNPVPVKINVQIVK